MPSISAGQQYPIIREAEKSEWTKKHVYYKHIGLYAYRTETLEKDHEIGHEAPLKLLNHWSRTDGWKTASG